MVVPRYKRNSKAVSNSNHSLYIIRLNTSLPYGRKPSTGVLYRKQVEDLEKERSGSWVREDVGKQIERAFDHTSLLHRSCITAKYTHFT